MTAAPSAVTFRSLFASRDFAVLYLAGTQSQVGDQLARVALSILVFTRTGSGLATAATYALTYLPAVIGGVVLTGLADVHPRRALLVVCDLLRAALYVLMALPGTPLLVVCALLVVAVLTNSPYNAAEPAMVADLFQGDRYTAALGLRTATVQAAQLLGFAVGGVIVAATGPRPALLIDAITFAASGLMLRFGLRYRPAAVAEARHGLAQLKVGLRTVGRNRRLRVLLALAWLALFWIVPEGLAAPYAATHGNGAAAVGILLAASPAGNLIGVLILTRWVPAARRPALLPVLTVGAGLPLLACGFGPDVPLAAVLWGLSGMCTAYLVLIVSEFVAIVPAKVRGQAIGLASSGLLAAQGIGLLLGGAIAAIWAVGPAIAVTGTAGSVLALALTRLGRGEQPVT
jgi:predicted MFS family arabinose efflux permease